MRLPLVLPLCLFSLAAAAPVPAPPPGWQLVWSDEFSTDGLPDPAKWAYENGRVRNNEAQFYTARREENARIENGILIIEARKEDHKGARFTSASLITKGRADWQYGRFEIRARLPAARGTWPAIWMLPADHGRVRWPDCGEIDIMEHVGHDPGVVHGTLHSGAFNHTKGNQRGGRQHFPAASTGFQIYAMEWSADSISMFVDGRRIASFARRDGDGEPEWPFRKPYYLILNLAIGGSWGGAKGIDEAAFPQRFEIDYVRVFSPTKR
jgi:beta-glucanase (GH16 family)